MNDDATLINSDTLFCLSGVLIFASWLLKTSLGRQALRRVPIRRNALSPLVLLLLLVVWQVLPSLLIGAIGDSLASLAPWRAWMIRNGIMCLASLLTMGVILGVAWKCFARGLRGFGLGVSRLHADVGRAAIILFTVMPLLLATISVTTFVGRKMQGPEYQIEQHEELSVLMAYPQFISRLLVVLLAVVMAPLVEEMLFRGVLQSLLRSHLDRPWLVIGMCSAMFAAVHADAAHWPTLFALSVGIGYAYESSGSLWQAIFVHAMFNGFALFNAITQGPPGA